ncbi:beta-phosphoglucomutase [Pediococcus cellicola]|uniref:PgmB protein n=1 Tax=Pediococcus cellicola TaxID=319652 RepID=A0A0R2IUF5_9LACO|nr:beta-phosphoglucomutase [Pediococcus cellicola]KRN65434.1 pgmB protein [Pediococcus cellicola]GEL15334.1 beta-phosphoglucomutase [Pediococcus cellicola]
MQGVLFDLDGVITDTARFHFKAWSRLAKEKLNVTLPASFESDLKGISRIDSMNRILKFAGMKNEYTAEEVNELAQTKNELYLNEISKLTQADILPGIENLLDELAANHVKLSVASASKNAPFILEKLGLKQQFDAIANPAKVKHGKPAPDIFIEAANQIHLTPQQCVGIEDAKAGVEAIKAAGAVAVGVGDANELHEADSVVGNTSELTYSVLKQAFEK